MECLLGEGVLLDIKNPFKYLQFVFSACVLVGYWIYNRVIDKVSEFLFFGSVERILEFLGFIKGFDVLQVCSVYISRLHVI